MKAPPPFEQLTEETTVEFRITVVLQPGDDPYVLEDHLTDQVCRFFGSTKCEEGVDCPRLWVASNSIVEGEPEMYSADWMGRESIARAERLRTADIAPPLWLKDASESVQVTFVEGVERPETYPSWD